MHTCCECDAAGEGAQVAAWEADFLEDLYKIRQLRSQMQAAVHEVSNPQHS